MALLLVSPKGLIPMEMYSLLINRWSFPKLANVGLPPNNLQQSSPRIKYTIDPPLRPMEPLNNLPLIVAWLLSLGLSNKVHPLFDTWVIFDYTFEVHNFFVRHLRILLTWLSWGHDSNTILGTTTLYNGMILSTLSMSSLGFAFGFPKRPHTNGDVFLIYKPMIIP